MVAEIGVQALCSMRACSVTLCVRIYMHMSVLMCLPSCSSSTCFEASDGVDQLHYSASMPPAGSHRVTLFQLSSPDTLYFLKGCVKRVDFYELSCYRLSMSRRGLPGAE
jgi:hypothetical protein